MKIDGQNLPDLLKNLPLPHKVLVAASAAFIGYAALYVPYAILSFMLRTPSVEALPLSDFTAETKGMADPSLGYDPRTQQVWMAYASEEASAQGPRQMHVRMAGTSGKCARWLPSPGGFEGKPDELLAQDGMTVFKAGSWRVETPSLVYDPDDKGREWKLYAYKYFWAKDTPYKMQIAAHFGAVVYKYASDPMGPWSAEQWLFSPAPDYPPPPYQQMVLLHLNRLDPSLRDVVSYTRPSVLYMDGALIMTLSAFTGGDAPDRIVMVISRDHGNSWVYAGTVVTGEDVKALGYTRLSGATLISYKDKPYLALVAGDEAREGQGTLVIAFADIAKGLLQRNGQGVPEVANNIALSSKAPGRLGGGFAAYTSACPFGLLTGEQTDGEASFRLFKTWRLPVGE